MPIRLRPATLDDVDAIHRVLDAGFDTYRDFAPPGWELPERAWDEQKVRTRLVSPDVWFTVATDANHVVGVAAALSAYPPGLPTPIPRLAALWLLFVEPRRWGRGVANELMRAALAAVHDRGFTSARLYTPRDHARARAFYERWGWRATGTGFFSDNLALPLVEYRVELTG